MPRAADWPNAANVGAGAQKDRHQAWNAAFGGRLVDNVGIGKPKLGPRGLDVVDQNGERVIVKLRCRAAGDNSRRRTGQRRG
jgi:hypothetical protein